MMTMIFQLWLKEMSSRSGSGKENGWGNQREEDASSRIDVCALSPDLFLLILKKLHSSWRRETVQKYNLFLNLLFLRLRVTWKATTQHKREQISSELSRNRLSPLFIIFYVSPFSFWSCGKLTLSYQCGFPGKTFSKRIGKTTWYWSFLRRSLL